MVGRRLTHILLVCLASLALQADAGSAADTQVGARLLYSAAHATAGVADLSSVYDPPAASTTHASNTRTVAVRGYDPSRDVSRSRSAAGGRRRATKAGHDVAQLAGPLRSALRTKAGFKSTGEPIIVDPSIGANPQAVAEALRARGINARSVREAFGRSDIQDRDILQVAEQLQGRVLASDRGRDIGGGFGRRAIRVPQRARAVDDVVRLFMEGG